MSLPSGRSIGVVVVAWVGAVIALGATRPDLAGSLSSGTGDDLARGTGWLVAAALTAWLTAAWLTATGLAIALRRRGTGNARRVLRRAPPIARHALRTALAGSLAVGPPPPVTMHVGTDGRLRPGTAPPSTAPAPTTTVPPRAPTTTTPRRAPRSSLPQPGRAKPSRHHVQPGDNLWTIARAELARRRRREPADRDVAPYWSRVIDANRTTLRSGDPNLIYPGEIVELPNP